MDIVASALGRDLDIEMSSKAVGKFQRRTFTKKKTGKKILEQTLNPQGVLVKEVTYAQDKDIAYSIKSTNLEKGIEVEEFDRNSDGVNEEKTETTIQGNQFLIRTFRKDTQGKWELFNSSKIPLTQESGGNQCSFRLPFPTEEYATMTGKILMQKESGEMVETVFSGVRVHTSCLNHFGPAVMSKIFESYRRGLNCLHNFEGTGTQANLAKIISTITNDKNPLKINCDKKSSPGVLGRATTSALQKDHPQMELYPDFSKLSNVSRTVFHETFHICGHKHGEGVEHAYGCADCCFDSNFVSKDSSAKSSCRLCGIHKDNRSAEYLSDDAGVRYDDAAEFIVERMLEGDLRQNLTPIFAKSIQYTAELSTLYSELHRRMGPLSEADKKELLSTPKETPKDINRRSERDLAIAIELVAKGKIEEATASFTQAANKLSSTPAEVRAEVQQILFYTSGKVMDYYDKLVKDAKTPTLERKFHDLRHKVALTVLKSSPYRNPPPAKPKKPEPIGIDNSPIIMAIPPPPAPAEEDTQDSTPPSS